MRESRRFALHLLAAVVILVLLGVHMAIMHLDGLLERAAGMSGDPLAWEQVMQRGRSLLFALTYVLLLGAALYHGLYGLRTMLLELQPRPGLRRAMDAAIWIGGIGLFAVGGFAVIATVTMAAAAPGAGP